jgi:hypothetical protein
MIILRAFTHSVLVKFKTLIIKHQYIQFCVFVLYLVLCNISVFFIKIYSWYWICSTCYKFYAHPMSELISPTSLKMKVLASYDLEHVPWIAIKYVAKVLWIHIRSMQTQFFLKEEKIIFYFLVYLEIKGVFFKINLPCFTLFNFQKI